MALFFVSPPGCSKALGPVRTPRRAAGLNFRIDAHRAATSALASGFILEKLHGGAAVRTLNVKYVAGFPL